MEHSGSKFIRVQLPIKIRFATRNKDAFVPGDCVDTPTAEAFSSLSNSTLNLNPQIRSPSPPGFSSLQMSRIKKGSLPKPSREQSWLYLRNWWLWWSEGLSNQHSWRVSISGVCCLLPQSLLVAGPLGACWGRDGAKINSSESRQLYDKDQKRSLRVVVSLFLCIKPRIANTTNTTKSGEHRVGSSWNVSSLVIVITYEKLVEDRLPYLTQRPLS